MSSFNKVQLEMFPFLVEKLNQLEQGRISKSEFEDVAEQFKSKEFCFLTLNNVSRSFAMIIKQLPQELRNTICIFYLVLRALDSIEDDISYPLELRLDMLNNFHKFNYKIGWKLYGVGDQPQYRVLLAMYDKVIEEFDKLSEENKDVITKITKEMGFGMSKYANKPINTIQDYDEYCHYVAGLVGIGLSDLFTTSHLESAELAHSVDLSNHMGLFLQKTNIIRDYFEDLNADRTFWPKEIWSKYVSKLENLRHEDKKGIALDCLNEMVLNALNHFLYAFRYLQLIENESVFRFCAIPQVMAFATLKEVYNNLDVFHKNVKISSLLTQQIAMEVCDIESTLELINKQIIEFKSLIELNNQNAIETVAVLEEIIAVASIEVE